MSSGGSDNNFYGDVGFSYRQRPVSPMPVEQVADTSGGKGGVYVPEDPNYYQQPSSFVGPPLPDNYQAPIFYQQPQITPQQFNNTGRLVDSTLLAQQAILGRQPVQYEPIIQPSTYQNFYANAQTMYPSVGGLLVPDYATKAQVFRQDFADAQAARDGEAGSVDATSTGDASSSVGGYGQSGLVDQDGGFVGDLGQGIDTPATQDVAFNVLAATENPVVQAAVPGAALANLAAGAYLDQQVSNINDSFNALDAGNTPGIATVSDNAGNVASFSTPGTVALSDANEFGGIATGLGIGDTGSTAPGAGGIADTGTVDVGGQTVSNTGTIAAQDAANFGPAFGLSPAPAPAPAPAPSASPGSLGGNAGDAVGAAGGFAPGISGDTFGGEGDSADSAGGGGGAGGGGKIICTAMNHHYGFGSFRNAIWIAYADKHLTKAHEVGYHTIFLPLVDFGFKRGDGKLNVIVRKIMEWGTRHRSTDLRAEMRGGKRDIQGRIIRFIFEPLCYAVGKLKGY